MTTSRDLPLRPRLRRSYFSAESALKRLFRLREQLQAPGSHPMSLDESIKGTRMSGDNERTLELCDLSTQVARAGVASDSIEWHALEVEHAPATVAYAVDDDRPEYHSKTKAEELRKRCGRTSTIRRSEYLRVLESATEKVRAHLEAIGWIPPRRRGFCQEPASASPPSRSSVRTRSVPMREVRPGRSGGRSSSNSRSASRSL